MSDAENQTSLKNDDRRGSKPDRGHRDKPNSHGSDQERLRMRKRDGERKTDHVQHHKDFKNGGFRRRSSYESYNRHQNCDYDRHRDHVRDGEMRHRYGRQSSYRSKRESRSRSRSPSHSESKRISGFDMAPPTVAGVPAVSGQMLGITHPVTLQNVPSVGMSQVGAFSLMSVQPMMQQATRHARRVYVGGLPPLTNEQAVAAFFSQVMVAIGGNSAGAGDSVVNVYINHEKKFAFVEMRTVEEASNAMALDGIIFEGVAVRVRRPTDYNPAVAAALGPSQPSPNLNLSAVGLVAGAIGGAEGPDRIFVGGLPYYFTEEQIKDLLQSFGPLRAFDLVRDKDTGNSKGYGFCFYQDPAVTDIACASLNGLKMGDKTLTVRRATVCVQSKTEQDHIFAQAQQHIAMQKVVLEAGGVNILGVERALTKHDENATKVLCLTEAITADQLRDDGEYEEILEDMRDECCKFGTLINVVIPRPNGIGEASPGVGKVFLEYSDSSGSFTAKNALNGRKFGGNVVSAFYYSEEKYHSSQYDDV
ncbi:splicing factor U2af large subunit B-like isoform X2 [Prosopis cineraria]|uniref:splicing factor U2af large subunit B-like isoform X2 n=1 Tax=Prosopis cineraria TaxID=364024 RepID=UPI0024103BB4|nr:splicing factor U2af large subunit B-like isoform X2 [Prosopis cineraria]